MADIEAADATLDVRDSVAMQALDALEHPGPEPPAPDRGIDVGL